MSKAALLGRTVCALVLLLSSAARGAEPRVEPAADATEANITLVTAGALERSQLAHHPLDSELAGRFLDRYLDDLDGSRSLFLQSDVKNFAAYRATLAQAIQKDGDTGAAHAIFSRYLRRLAQRAAYVTSFLLTTKLDFTGHDVYAVRRQGAARPRDLQAAQQLWQQEIRAEYLREKLAGKSADQIVHALLRREARRLATMTALRRPEVLEIYLNALAHVYDPHTDYLGHQQLEDLTIAMSLSLVGIGASLESEDGYCKIRELLPGGPAMRSGQIGVGDAIVAIAQSGEEPVDVTNMPLFRVGELVRGPKGTTVTLTILPRAANGSPPKKLSLVREEVKLEDQQAKARIWEVPDSQGHPLRVGIIELPSFYAEMDGQRSGEPRSATADVARLLAKLQREHVRGVVLDLRTNGGGALEEAISMTGLFIGRGPVVQTRGPDGGIEVGAAPDATVRYDGPLVVLTSRFSASASEILAGALQDYGRAVVVGDPSTFGKGTVQSILPLALAMDRAGFAHTYDPGALKVTTGKFYRPDGASTQLRGVASDIVLPSPSDLPDINESALRDPLPWDSVPAVRHDELNRVRPYLAVLRARSRDRVNTDKRFLALEEDLARLKKSLSERSVSLNEQERRDELARIKARQSARQPEALAAISRPTTYTITLRDAASPGLPPPGIPGQTGTGITLPTTASRSSSAPDDFDPTPTADRSGPDIVLEETVNILEDYAALLGGSVARHANVGAVPASAWPVRPGG